MRILILIISVLTVGNSFGQFPTQSLPPLLKQMNGYWKPESVVFDGKERLDEQSKKLLTLWIKDSEYRMFFASDPEKDLHFRVFTADITINETQKSFELTVKDGQKKGEKRHGIFELKDNKLTICYGAVDRPRPTAFQAPAGSGFFLETWNLEKR